MGDTKLCLLLLICTIVLINAQDEGAQCFLAKRYKSFHKYEYTYETESLNALNGAINGPKASCKVEIEVPGTCSYIVRTTECTLSEVISVDGQGNPVFGPSAGADDFKAAMEKNPLKVTVEGDDDIKLFPEDDEPINILNIKRGLISALAVPLLEEEKNKRMPTIYGLCKTGYSVNTREDIATDVTLNRDLSKCDNFRPVKDHTSPLALITGLHYPLAQLFRSSQTCNYKFDNKQKHMTSSSCTENHILVPFSYKGQYGVNNVGKQSLTLVGVTEYNDRIFDHNVANVRTLHLDGSADEIHPIQDKEVMLTVLRELAGLSKTNNGHNRAHLAHKLVAIIRKMSVESLTAGLPEALEISRSLMYQALFQCGTSECSSAIMQVLRTFDSSSVEIDAAVYAMGMVPDSSRVLVKEMLEMAKFKASKPIYYALSNAVRRLYDAEDNVTPEIQAVADYALKQIGDCTGDQEHIYLTLRVIGNMAAALGAASSALKSAVIQCINQPAASSEVQQAAIQAFRLTPVPEEERKVLMQVLLDGAAPVPKRVAAYLIVMKDPQPSELAQLLAVQPNNENFETMSFVNSHLNNILGSKAPKTKELREKILNALQGNAIDTEPTTFSRNYKIGSLEGNVIFESADYLPNEVVLDMTLNAFGYYTEMIEIGMKGKGLEPTIDALIGIDGFFRDTVQKTINYAADKIPKGNEVLQSMFPDLWNGIRMNQAPKSMIKEITNNVNKLIQNLKAQDNPEAMIYLRLLGAELGYLKTKDVQEMAYSAALLTDSLFKMFPTDFIRSLFSSSNNDLFLHYIFMDNEFYLPTGSGVPLRVAVSGTFTPGVKGGLKIARDMSEIAFMPSAGIEFVTEVGAFLPNYVQSGLEMHTNIYHESGLRAKVALTNQQIKLTIPAPSAPTKLISVTNSLVSVMGAETKTIPEVMERINVEECTPLIPGLKYCSALQYSDAFSNDTSPYFPLTGDSKFAIEIHPSGEVSEYTATLDYAYEDKVDKLTLGLKAEGTSFEGTAKVMFNRQKYTVSADLQIPDYDLEAGLRFGAVDPNTKGKGTHSIQIDFINKNIPQASLVGLAKIEAMKDAMLQVQLLIPDLADAKVSASMERAEGLTLELKSDIKLNEASSMQKVTLKYDAEQIEAEVKSDVSSGLHNIIPIHTINSMVIHLLDQQIGQSEMKIRDVLIKSAQATNDYLEQYASEIPYVQDLRIPTSPEFTLPERLFLNVEGAAKYKFGQDYHTFTFPVPFGVKYSGESIFPATLTTPNLKVPQLGLEVSSVSIPLPEVYIPESLSVSLPGFKMVEVSSKLSSNPYNLEASASAGFEFTEDSSYTAKIEVTGTSPVDLLSFKVNGTALVISSSAQPFKAEMKTVVSHKLIDASVSVLEELTGDEKLKVKSISKIEAASPLGMKTFLEYTAQTELDFEGLSGNGNLVGSIKAGPLSGNTIVSQSYTFLHNELKAKMDSSLNIDSFFQAKNTIDATWANKELFIVSKTTAFEDILTHNAELTCTESLLALRSGTKAMVLGVNIQNDAEASAGIGMVNVKIETTAERSGDRITSQITAALDVNKLAVNSDASAKLAEYTAFHKSSLSLTKDGLTTNGTTSLISPLTFENNFNAALDASMLSLYVETNGAFAEITVDNTNRLSASLSSVALTSKAQANVADGTSYAHDISVQMEPFSTVVSIDNHLKILHVDLVNKAQFKADPYKADMTGSLKLSSGKEELKHIYEIRYADLVATAKCSTTGKLMGSHMSHNTEIEIAGFAVKVNNDGRFSSQSLRFNGNLHATAVPFSFNVDGIANAEGDLNLYGKQSGQIYTKFLLKAEPLAFVHSHECRVSTTQNMDNGISIETNLYNKVDTLLTPSEQKATVKVESKVNNHVLSQDVSAYNTPQRLGLEVSGSIITNLFNTVDSENQDNFFSAFLKYDKNSDSHVISLPLIENIPAILENLKVTIIRIAEALQSYINREDIAAKIQDLPKYINDFVNELNLEERLNQIRQDLIVLTPEYAITVENLEASLVNLRAVVEKLVNDLGTRVDEILREISASGTVSEVVLQTLTEELNALNEKYDIRSVVLAVIEAIEDVIKQIDTMKLEDTSISILHDLDEQYAIKSKLEEIVNELKQMVAKFDTAKFIEDVKHFATSVNFKEYLDHLKANIPTEEISKLIDSAKQLLTEMNVVGRLNAIYSYLREIMMKYEVDKMISKNVEELTKQFKQTIHVLINTLKSIQIPVTQLLDDSITYLKTTDIKQIIEHLNNYLNNLIKSAKSFDYNAFVANANQIIREYTTELNTLIVSLEIQQKFNAIREFVNYALSSINAFLEKLRTTKVADVFKGTLEEVRAFAEKLQQRPNDLIWNIEHREITISGVLVVAPPITISFDYTQDIIDFITALESFDVEVFGDLRINYLPDLSAVTLPEIILPEISFPEIPKFIDKHQFADLKIPEYKLPAIPSELIMPCFGKLYGEVRVNIPIYNLRTTVEFNNSTSSAETPQFTAYINSLGTSSEYDILRHTLDSTARIAVPKMSRVIVAETLKFTHSALAVEHKASLTIYGLSAQATSKTTLKVTTAPYTADVLNTASFGLEDGMSAMLKTTYSDKVNIHLLSLTSEHSFTHEVEARQDGVNIALTIVDDGKGKYNIYEYSDNFNYKSKLSLIMNPATAKLTYSAVGDSTQTTLEEIINIDVVPLSHINFNTRIEGTSELGHSFLVNATGKAHLADMKVEMKATHDTKFVGIFTLSNALNFLVHPTEMVLNFQNKGNAKVPVSVKTDFQNDYAIILNTDKQQMSTVALVRFNQQKYSHNFTVVNNKSETGMYASVNGEANLEQLTIPFSIPGIIDLSTDLYEDMGLKHLLTTPEQTIDVDAKMVYQKSTSAPIINLGLINVPSVGNLISEVSFKSSIVNLNGNAGIYGEDNLVIRFGATSTSEFEALKVKLEGTSSLSTKSGIKLATAVVLGNTHIEGTHNSTVTINMDNYEAALSMGTATKIHLPILTAEANHQLTADTKTHPNVASTLRAVYTLDIPFIKLAGKGNAENTLKFEGSPTFISVETATTGSIDGTFLDTGIVKGALNNDESIYLNGDGLRSTLKTVGNGNLNYGDLKVEFDVDESLALEADINRVFAVLKFSSKNEVNAGTLNTKGEHTTQATVDLEPLKSLVADVKINLSQPSTFGDLGLSEMMVVELTLPKQTAEYTLKLVSPVYTKNIVAKVDGNAPVFKTSFKVKASSPVVFLEYDLDSTMSTEMENDALAVNANTVLTHADFTMDINNVVKTSDPSYTLTVDITSPTFTDVNFRYAARGDGLSASVSTPSSGYLGLQLQPSQMNARLYSRYASAPNDDIDILTIKAAARGDEKIRLLATYKLEAPHDMLEGLKERLPAITSSVTQFAEKHGILDEIEGLKKTTVNIFNEAYTAASSHTPELSELSILFRNIVVQYQKTTQTLLDAVIKFLQETKFKLPGMDETTLPEICKKICTFVAEFVDLDSPAVFYEKMGQTLQEVVEKLQEVVDSIKSDTLEVVAGSLNTYYTYALSVVKRLVDSVDAMSIQEQLNAVFEQYIEPLFKTFHKMFTDVISSLPSEAETMVKVSDGRLEIELPLTFFQ